MLACDFDTQQMEQAELFLATIMDERAAQDAMACQVVGGIEASETEEQQQQPLSAEPVVISSIEASSISYPASPERSSPDSSVAFAAHPMPPPLSLSIVESEEDQPVQWDLISPWSEGDEEIEPSSPASSASFQYDRTDEDDASSVTSSSIIEPESEARMEARLRELVETETAMALEAKLSRAASGGNTDDEDAVIRDHDVDEDDEEFDVYNNNENMFVKEIGSVEEFFEEKLDSTATEEDENEDGTDGTRTSVATTMDDSCEESPRASTPASNSPWGRIRSQTYNGSAAVSTVKSACKMIRSRTLSTTSSFRSSSQSRTSESMEDDGDFSSDDEGCSRDRTSRMGGSFSSTRRTLTSRLSVKVPAKMSLWRTRTSSATTTASEDSSYPTSPQSSVRGDAQSGFPFNTIEDPSALKTGSPQQQRNQQMQAFKNKASVCASKAAGYLNAASAEAARKLKAKTFRGGAAAKPTASETEEEAEPPSLSEATA